MDARKKLFEWVNNVEDRYNHRVEDVKPTEQRSVWKHTVEVLMEWIESLERRCSNQPKPDSNYWDTILTNPDEPELFKLLKRQNDRVRKVSCAWVPGWGNRNNVLF